MPLLISFVFTFCTFTSILYFVVFPCKTSSIIPLFSDQTCYDLVKRNRKMADYTIKDSKHPYSASERYHMYACKSIISGNILNSITELVYICFDIDCSRYNLHIFNTIMISFIQFIYM